MHLRPPRADQKTTSTRTCFAVTLGLSVILALAAATGAAADPSIKEKRAQAQAILAEAQELDEEVGAAAERWNGATLELQSLRTELDATKRDLTRARDQYRISQARVAERLRDLYVNGAPQSALEVLLGARTLDEVIAGLEATERVATQDAEITRQTKGLKQRVAKREEQLSRATAEQGVLVENLAAEKQAIEATLAERQTLLASVRDEVARLEAAERRRQAELRRQARLELERQQRAVAAAAAAASEASQESATPTEAAPGEAVSLSTPEVPDYVPPPADAGRGAQVVAIAMQYLGIPYIWAAANPAVGFDCSGLTKYVFAQVGVSLPHYAAAQYQLGYAVSKEELQPGDLVFFRGLGHMGMYIGGGNMIHAPRTGDVVKISPLSDSYYVENWVGARRVL